MLVLYFLYVKNIRIYFRRFMYQGFNVLYFASVQLFCIAPFTYIFPDIMSDTFKVTCHKKLQEYNWKDECCAPFEHLNCIQIPSLYMSSINHMKQAFRLCIFCTLHFDCTLTNLVAKKQYSFSLYSNSSNENHHLHSIGA